MAAGCGAVSLAAGGWLEVRELVLWLAWGRRCCWCCWRGPLLLLLLVLIPLLLLGGYCLFGGEWGRGDRWDARSVAVRHQRARKAAERLLRLFDGSGQLLGSHG
jgi:hypothetical protein